MYWTNWLIDWLNVWLKNKMAEKVGGGTPYAEAVLEVNIQQINIF